MYMKAFRLAAPVLLAFVLMIPAQVPGVEAQASARPAEIAAFVPTGGTWSGTTSRGDPISFQVNSSGTAWTDFSLTVHGVINSCEFTSTTVYSGPGAITNNQFSFTESTVAFAGQFASALSATGTYAYTDESLPGCGILNQSGTWSASRTVTPPGAFAKISPSIFATDQSLSLTLSWSASSNASQYQYCVDTTNDGTCSTSWISAGNHTSIAITGLSGGTTYYWQVRAVNLGGKTYADSSTWWPFTTYTPLQATYRSDGVLDGSILESGENSGVGGKLNSTGSTFLLGDSAGNKQYRAILSFDTGSLPDTAVLLSVTLKIRKAGQSPADPFSTLGNILADIETGSFNAPALELGDFQAAASKNAALAFANTPVNGWYSRKLGAAKFSFVNKTGPTQFRLRFALDDNNDHIADFDQFFSGDATTATNAPALVIRYFIP